MENTGSPKIYQPSAWSYDFVQSLKIDQLAKHEEWCDKLEAEVRATIDNNDIDPFGLLNLIDKIQRLGLGYRFEKNVIEALNGKFLREGCINSEDMSLHGVALTFRLMRQNGYEISQDVFKPFKDKNGDFKASLCNDINGMLSLYEATYLSFEGEEILAEAQKFTTTHLKGHTENSSLCLAEEVRHALELPLHRRMTRLEAREHIDTYRNRENANHVLLELAVLDFNWVQLALKSELQDMSRWWNETGLPTKLSFVRDRITESFFASVGLVANPQYNKCRKGLTKTIALVAAIDDIYDEYGSLEQLELYTQAVERWNLDEAKALPECMILTLKVLFDTVNDIAYDNYRDQGINTISNLRKAWTDLCKSFLLEAKWEHSKHQPKFEDYLENAWVSSTGVVILVHAYCLVCKNITNEALYWLDNHHDIIRHPSMIFRLTNDLSSSWADMEEKFVAKSIPCYVNDFNISAELARAKIRNLIEITWQKMNKDIQGANNIFTRPFIDIVLNLARTTHCIYQYGDGHKAPNDSSRKQVLKLLIEPIELKEEN